MHCSHTYKIFTAIGSGSDNFCMDQLKFYGMDSHTTSADDDISFSTCSLIDYDRQSPSENNLGLWLKNDKISHGWKDPGKPYRIADPIHCTLATTRRIQAINMKVCKPLNDNDNTGTLGENIALKMVNKNGEKCETVNVSPYGGFKPGIYYSIDQYDKLKGESKS